MARIDAYFREMKDPAASDLHMVIGFPPLLRLRGDLVPMAQPVLTPESNRQILFEILTPEQRTAIDEKLDMDKAYELTGIGRFRCNFFYQNRGIGAVFRLIPTDIITLEQLQLPPVLNTIANFNKGLVLVTGPTGSGKSTTLAAMIDYINETRDAHIITIEDPLEFVHPNKKCLITHREIGTHARSFSEALRVASREDPDIILVGEMRDTTTISLGAHLTADRVSDYFIYPIQKQRMHITCSVSGHGIFQGLGIRPHEPAFSPTFILSLDEN